MTKNQKILLGCGGAGCLGVIVVAIVVFGFIGWSQMTTRGPVQISNNRNANTSLSPQDISSSPQDPNAVLAELMAVEAQWREAAIKGDAAALGTFFADEFANRHNNGRTSSKSELIAALIKFMPDLKTYQITDARLTSLSGDHATLNFLIIEKWKDGNITPSRNANTWVKRGGRWQLVKSESVDVVRP
jgi:hypothetical protein